MSHWLNVKSLDVRLPGHKRDKRRNIISYIDALHDRAKDKIHVVERDQNGKRVYKEYPVQYICYFDDSKGKFTTSYDTPVSRFVTTSNKEFRKELKIQSHKKVWESDCNVVFRCLETNYLGKHSPTLHTALIDIESDFCLEKGGFAPIEDPFNKITAITVYLDWLDQLITLAIPPTTLSFETASNLVSKFENTYLFATEEEMLSTFLTLIEDADLLSGWNSEGYDIPYIVGRILRALSKDDTRRLCLWDQYPKERKFERYGAETFTYDLVGRVHLDYMQLYQKYTFEERHSYSLDSIGEYELGERKISYDGSLDQLYNQDFYKFIEYNRQDVLLLVKLDRKLRLIDMANDLAHTNTVLLSTTMGSVAIIDQAIINEAHSLGKIVQNKKASRDKEEDDDSIEHKAAGAYVATPKTGMHHYIGAIDINSLYPSTIRRLNMAPETLIGQLRPVMTEKYISNKMSIKTKNNGKSEKGDSFAAAWDGLFGSLEYIAVMKQDPNTEIIIDWENGESNVTTADVVYDLIFKRGKPWILSANGTIFRSDKEGIIPGLLRKWYADRKMLQKKKKEATTISNGIPITIDLANQLVNTDLPKHADVFDPSLLLSLIKDNDVTQLQSYMDKFRLMVDEQTIRFRDYADAKYWIYYYDKNQNIKKILLNSAYGALLNVGCRFNDQRIGQSTTLTGRVIAKHMDSFVNECITGEYDHVGKAIIYGDTDSVFFSAWPMIKDQVNNNEITWDRDVCVQLYDNIADQLNASFPAMMEQSFHCPSIKDEIIRGGRELVGSQGLFIKKKRYAVLIYDMEGTRYDLMDEETAQKKGIHFGLGKVKAMGLDLKRSDTPKIVQTFLSDILLDVLHDVPRENIFEKIRSFKRRFAELPAWEKGTPKRVNNLTKYTQAEDAGGANLPGHVRASMNWNTLRRMNGDNYSMEIVDGMKVIVCSIKSNPMGFTSVAYPIDEERIPDWFKDLPFDNELMEETIVNKKIENLLGILNWDIDAQTQTKTTFSSLFSFD